MVFKIWWHLQEFLWCLEAAESPQQYRKTTTEMVETPTIIGFWQFFNSVLKRSKRPKQVEISKLNRIDINLHTRLLFCCSFLPCSKKDIGNSKSIIYYKNLDEAFNLNMVFDAFFLVQDVEAAGYLQKSTFECCFDLCLAWDGGSGSIACEEESPWGRGEWRDGGNEGVYPLRKLPWQAGKSTKFEDAFPIQPGDFPLSCGVLYKMSFLRGMGWVGLVWPFQSEGRHGCGATSINLLTFVKTLCHQVSSTSSTFPPFFIYLLHPF